MPKKLQISDSSVEAGSGTSNENVKIQLSNEERLQLEEQIRKFVQLVTQFYLLSFGSSSNSEENSQLKLINESSKAILLDLGNIALQNITFAAYNLSGALDILNEFEIMKDACAEKGRKSILHLVKKTIFHSKVFMYPELLPKLSFIGNCQKKKIIFTKGEDNLIALGLERFSGEFAPIHKIQLHLLPTKKVSQIQIRIKNLRSSKAPKDNPVKYYYAHRKAPPIPRNVQIFDPSQVKAPKHLMHSNNLPGWIVSTNPVQRQKFAKIAANSMTAITLVPQPLFILPKGVTIQNHSILYPVISQQLDFNRNEKSSIKTAKCSVRKVIQNKLPLILPKNVRKNDKKFLSEEGDENKKTDDAVNMQNIDKPSVMLSENSNIESAVEAYELSVKTMTTPPCFLPNKFDKTEIYSDIVIKSEFVEEACDSSLDESLGDYNTTKISSSRLLNGLDNEQNSKFVENKIEKDDIKNATSVFEVAKLVQPHHNKQEIIDSFKIIEACEFSPDVNTNKSNMFIKNTNKCKSDRQDMNNSKHTLVSKQLSKFIDYNPEPNDKKCKRIQKGRKIQKNKKFKIQSHNTLYPVISRQLDFTRSKTNSNEHTLSSKQLSESIDYSPDVVDKKLKRIQGKKLQNNKTNKKYKIQNNSRLYPVISQQLDFTSNETNNIKTSECNAEKVMQNKSSLILPKHVKKNDKETYSEADDKSRDTNNAVNMPDIVIDKPVVLLNAKNSENSNIKSIIGTYEVSDKTKIASDIVIKTEVMEDVCDSLQNKSLGDYNTAKATSSILLNLLETEQSSKFVESEIEKKYIENTASVFEKATSVQPHHIKQEITDHFKTVQACEFSPDVNTNKSNILIKTTSKCNNDRQKINNSTNTLISKQYSKSIDYIPDPNDEKSAVVIKSEIIEENDDSTEDKCKIDLNLEKTLFMDPKSPANDYNYSLQEINLISENLHSINKTSPILHSFHTNLPKPVQKGDQHDSYPLQKIKSNDRNTKTVTIADLASYKEEIFNKPEIIDDSEILPQNTSHLIFNKPVLKTTKNVIKSNSLEKAHIKESNKTIGKKRKLQNFKTKRNVRKRN